MDGRAGRLDRSLRYGSSSAGNLVDGLEFDPFHQLVGFFETRQFHGNAQPNRTCALGSATESVILINFLKIFTALQEQVFCINSKNKPLMAFWVHSLADAPTPWQMGFQDPATASMEGIVDLHHDICFFLLVILVLVLWLGARIVLSFHWRHQPTPERFNHHTNLELVWAILPSLIVTLIALPSLTLIYTFDDLVAKPALTVKVLGKQWYWSYQIKEHVQQALVHPELLLESSSLILDWHFLCSYFSFFKNFLQKRAFSKVQIKILTFKIFSHF